MASIITFAKPQLLDKEGQFLELGAMAGIQRKRYTYCREYKHGSADDIREKVEKAVERGEKGTSGGFFQVTEKLNEEAKNQSSLRYVTQKLKLDILCGLSIEDLWLKCETFGEGFMLSNFFDPIEYPQENDLVVYTQNKSHFGIYKERNSLLGGTVESKWDSGSYIFQHDIFFVPPNYGDTAQFYRLKSGPVKLDDLEIKPHKSHTIFPLTTNAVYTVQADHSLTFNLTKENLQRRALIDMYSEKELITHLPESEILPTTFLGICHYYALTIILNKKYSNTIEGYLYKILDNYFVSTSEPQKGDLVEYYSGKDPCPVHSAIYLGDGRVESKWGAYKYIFRHYFFDVPISYGNTIKCFRLKSGLDKEKLQEALKSTYDI